MASQVHPYAASARMTPSGSLNGSQTSASGAVAAAVHSPSPSTSANGGGLYPYPSVALSRTGSSGSATGGGFSPSSTTTAPMMAAGSSSQGGPSSTSGGGRLYPSPALERTHSSTFVGGGGLGPGMSASSSGDSTPIATNSALNLKASASSSIYQRCTALRERLYRVPEFRNRFVDEAEQSLAAIASTSSAPVPAPAASAAFTPDLPLQTDPVSQVLSVLRLGASLCFLFNRLGHAHQLDVNPQATLSNLKACQRGAAHFIMACKQDLQWLDEDLFAVSELYGQDTNGIVKVKLLSHALFPSHMPTDEILSLSFRSRSSTPSQSCSTCSNLKAPSSLHQKILTRSRRTRDRQTSGRSSCARSSTRNESTCKTLKCCRCVLAAERVQCLSCITLSLPFESHSS